MKNIINCPKCKWQPTSGKLWECSCHHIWDTFNTGGQCPKCKKIWADTCCPRCHRWSPHIDWYGFDKLLKTELENVNIELDLEK